MRIRNNRSPSNQTFCPTYVLYNVYHAAHFVIELLLFVRQIKYDYIYAISLFLTVLLYLCQFNTFLCLNSMMRFKTKALKSCVFNLNAKTISTREQILWYQEQTVVPKQKIHSKSKISTRISVACNCLCTQVPNVIHFSHN